MKLVLKGPRVTLRTNKVSEAAVLWKWLRDKEIVKFLHPGPKESLDQVKKRIRKRLNNKDLIPLSIYNERMEHIGNTSLHLVKCCKKASLALFIGEKNEWNKGYAKETIRILGDYIFKKLKYNRFDLGVLMDNKKAFALYKKLGFKLEGKFREHIWNPVTKRFEDEYQMSILKREWVLKNKLIK